MIDKEKQAVVVATLGNAMAEHLQANMPVTAAFRTYRIRFEVCGTQNVGLMELAYMAPGEVYGQLGVCRMGDDRMFSNFIPVATDEEMLGHLQDSAIQQEWVEQLAYLSDRVDDYWD